MGEGQPLTFGPLPATDTAFRALAMLMALHPAYRMMPLGRLPEVHNALWRGHNFCAVRGDQLLGALLWLEVTAELARTCIEERRMPTATESTAAPGDAAIIATCFIAPEGDAALGYWRAFSERYRGKPVLVMRHTPGRESRFLWQDREGRLRGKAY